MAMVASALVGALLAGAPPASATDQAAAFARRESVSDISLSPGGTRIAYIAPAPGQGSVLFTVDLAGDRTPKRVVAASGRPERLANCDWVSDARLVCKIYAIGHYDGDKAGFTRLIAVDADGGNVRLVSNRDSSRAVGVSVDGGSVLDLLPGEDGTILAARSYVAESQTGTRLASSRSGYGVDRIDTRTLRATPVEPAKENAVDYITDGSGTVRIMGMTRPRTYGGYATGIVNYFYRAAGSRDWKPLGDLDTARDEGFDPLAVDARCNCAYGLRKADGRLRLVRIALDASKREETVLSRPDVDVDQLIRLGRARRVVGASYATERREAVYFDPVLNALGASLSKALPGLPLIDFAGASADESKLLIRAGSDADPGRYYVYDKATRKLDELMLARPELEGTALATVKPVSYRAADGTMVPAYLTLPPGSDGHRLPALVMPHGGPSARDEWGFDWLAQFFAARGFAVLQPNYRGSSGYGDAWFRDRGFRNWQVAIGDVDDGGRWLVASGIADPAKLAIVGWSYGGYAALQSGVLDPGLFKAIVAVAPVTDLAALKEGRRQWADFQLVSAFVGTGPHVAAGSPAQNAARIAAPVLIFHGDQDLNVDVSQGRTMADRLRSAGKPVELVVYPGLDHQLEDSAARRDLLTKSDAFLRRTLGM